MSTRVQRIEPIAHGRDWEVTGWYGDRAEYPKQPGGLALKVRCKSDFACDMEISAFESRPDIGRIGVRMVDAR